MIGIGTHRRAFTDFDTDAQALFDRITTPPTNARKTIINDLIVGLKNDGNWAELDVLVLLAAADSQAALLDCKNLQDGAEALAPAFVADRGYTSDGVTSYINTQFNPSTQGVQYTQNNASFGFYMRTDVSEGKTDMGLFSAGDTENLINSSNGVGLFQATINSDTIFSVAIANSLGLSAVRRTTNNLEEGFKNGVSIGTQADTSQALINDNFYSLCRNNVGIGAEFFSTKQNAMYFLGSGDLNQSTFRIRIQTYMTAIGAQV